MFIVGSSSRSKNKRISENIGNSESGLLLSPKSIWVKGQDFNNLYDPDFADSQRKKQPPSKKPGRSPQPQGKLSDNEKRKVGLDLEEESTGTVPQYHYTGNRLSEITSLKE